MARNVGHLCSEDDKYCREGMDPARHPEHGGHKGGCICPLGEEITVELSGYIKRKRGEQ
jgi:hypothetical protein